jgi:hypothetical protein
MSDFPRWIYITDTDGYAANSTDDVVTALALGYKLYPSGWINPLTGVADQPDLITVPVNYDMPTPVDTTEQDTIEPESDTEPAIGIDNAKPHKRRGRKPKVVIQGESE